MPLCVAKKVLLSHIVEGKLGETAELGITMDQTLTQDSTGTMAYLQFEAMGIKRVKTDLSVAYVDHNTVQSGFENADDHEYIRSVAKKHGIRFSKPGNGICHQVHLERLGVPGKTLIGSDSHTPTAGGIGMLAIGAGGLDVAVAMGGGTYYISSPKVLAVNLTGKLVGGTGAKDIILEVLRQLSVKGGVGKIIEYRGDGVATLSVPERATITNMGAELGATTSIFPSDDVTRQFLKAQGREHDFVELAADDGAEYDGEITVALGALKPLAATPHMPDNVCPVSDVAGLKVDQVCIGSCTNSSLYDMLKVAAILKGKTVAENVSLVISPGSRQVLNMLSECGALSDIVSAGARIIECACGPCIGMGQAPKSGAVSLRTFNRNFEGRSGTKDAHVYLVSPETAAASALTGVVTDPTELCKDMDIKMPERFTVNDNMVIMPASEAEAESVEVVRGPNIQPFPKAQPLGKNIEAPVVLKVGDNITTDHIMPSGASLLPYRSNIPYLSGFCFSAVDSGFPERAKQAGHGIIVAGQNYGQGSSREHAALVPLYLGIKAVIAKSFARIHRDNLINNGIVPFVFASSDDCDALSLDSDLMIENIIDAVTSHDETIVLDKSTGNTFTVKLEFTKRQRNMLIAGGLLNYTKNEVNKK